MDENEKLKKDIAEVEAVIEGLLVDIESGRRDGGSVAVFEAALPVAMRILGDKQFELEMRLQLEGMRLCHGE